MPAAPLSHHIPIDTEVTAPFGVRGLMGPAHKGWVLVYPTNGMPPSRVRVGECRVVTEPTRVEALTANCLESRRLALHAHRNAAALDELSRQRSELWLSMTFDERAAYANSPAAMGTP